MVPRTQVSGSIVNCTKCGLQNAAIGGSCMFCQALLPRAPAQGTLLRPGAPPIDLDRTKTFTFGRLPDCSVMISAPTVSRLHAEITWPDGDPVLTDHSTFGTLVDGKPIKAHHLVPGDEIEIGPFRCTYTENQSEARSAEVRQQTLPGSGPMLVGLIPEGGLSECLQALEFNGKTGTLYVFGSGKGQNAWLAVRAGIPLAAEADGQVDEEAVLALLRLTKGRFSFSRELTVDRRRMAKNISALLFEAGRRADESNRSSP